MIIIKFKIFVLVIFLFLFLYGCTTIDNTYLDIDFDGIPSLHEEYSDYFTIGTAVAVSTWNRTIDSHKDLIEKHFNSVTAENAMKPESLQPAEGYFNFDTANELLNFAEGNDMKVRGHTLVWHSQTPHWFFEDENGNMLVELNDSNIVIGQGYNISDENRQLVIDRMKKHIEKVMNKYQDRVYAWDVVNEAIDRGTYRHSAWLEIIGEEYIAKAFNVAHEVDPDVKLFYNDYNTIQRRNEIYEMLKGLIKDGVPVHGMGMQGHWDIHGPSIEEIETTIKLFASLDELTDYDFEIQITELDISMFAWGDERHLSEPTQTMLNLQAERYKQLFELFKEYSDVITGVTLWGVADDATWLDYFPVQGRNDWPLLFDEDHEPKEAFWEIIKLNY
ncbi:endo-1,4-beta-xylanase [Natronospora cellulosivora (SeqCode)]